MNGARPPLAPNARYDQMMQALGGRSEWWGRLGQRVLPPTATLVDDPTLKEFQGQPLAGSYEVDEEGVRAEKVALVENGILRRLLMSRRPGPDFERSNGHGRATFLADAKPMMSNLVYTDSEALPVAELRQRFLQECKDNGQRWGLIVKAMDNPVIASSSQEELSDALGVLATGATTGLRLPLLVYRVNADTGEEELVRGALFSSVTVRSLRNILGVGNDPAVFSYAQNQEFEFSGTALNAFGSAQGGVPTSVVAPSLLFGEIEVRGPRSEARRTSLIPPPPLQ
jgi:hypothetical protein